MPEVAFVGRSNAGKSSSLNRLAGHRQLARVSKTPGRTQLINLFAVADGGRLADLPGYGYARASMARRAAWGRTVDAYLNHRANLVGVVLVMDARLPPQPFDQDMIAWCGGRNMPMLALLNKADKLKHGPRSKALNSLSGQVPAAVQALLFSARTGLGGAEAVAFLRERFSAAGSA